MDKVVEAVDKMSLQLTTMKTLVVDTLTVMSCSYVNYDFDLPTCRVHSSMPSRLWLSISNVI